MRYYPGMTDAQKTSVYLTADLKERMRAVGLKPAEAMERGVTAAEGESRESLEAMISRAVRDGVADAVGPLVRALEAAGVTVP